MIGSALKKLAKENGMRVDSGVAYGSYRGYAATFSEGAGFKRIDFATRFPENGAAAELRVRLDNIDLMKEYRVQNISIAEKAIVVVFHDNPGTMKKLCAFLDWLIPQLDELGASKVELCSECGQLIGAGGAWKLIGGTAHHLHETCADKVCRDIRAAEQQERMEDTGSYAGGIVGALLGALVGAVPWALVMVLGYVASILGLLIGFLAEKGYRLMKGREGKGKIWILVISVVIGVVTGTVASEFITVAQMVAAGELGFMNFGDIPALIVSMWVYYPEYSAAVIKNILMGLLFAALGVFGILYRTHKETSDIKVTSLK